MTYAELQDRITRYMHRNDLAGDIPGFIELAESRINDALRSQENEIAATLAMTSSPFALPEDYAELSAISVAATGGPRPLQRLPAEQFARARADTHRTGGPRFFLVEARALSVAPFLGSVAEPTVLTLTYWGQMAKLVNDADTTPALDRFPQLYLYGALIEAYWFISEFSASSDALQRFVDELAIINTAAMSSKWGSAPAIQAG